MMRLERTMVIGIAFVALLWTSAVAQTVPPSGFGEKKPDILGITSDMDSDGALQHLQAYAKTWSEQSVNFQQETNRNGRAGEYIRSRGVSLQPQNEVEWAKHGGAESIYIQFTAPGSGNRAVEMKCQITFSDRFNPPKIGDFMKLIFDKYGLPTAVYNDKVVYQYKSGIVVSGARVYTPESAVASLAESLGKNNVVDEKTRVDVDACTGSINSAFASNIAARAKKATCDAGLSVYILTYKGAISGAIFLSSDLKRLVGSEAIELNAKEESERKKEENDQKRRDGLPRGAPTKL